MEWIPNNRRSFGRQFSDLMFKGDLVFIVEISKKPTSKFPFGFLTLMSFLRLPLEKTKGKECVIIAQSVFAFRVEDQRMTWHKFVDATI